jgi:hypothetical protein
LRMMLRRSACWLMQRKTMSENLQLKRNKRK